MNGKTLRIVNIQILHVYACLREINFLSSVHSIYVYKMECSWWRVYLKQSEKQDIYDIVSVQAKFHPYHCTDNQHRQKFATGIWLNFV